MKKRPPYPQLSDFMGGYLHQDYSLWYESDDAAIKEFAEVYGVKEVRRAVKELDSLLAGPLIGLLALFEKEIQWLDYIIGETDDEARAWLLKARGIMVDVLERRGAS